ncbi:glycosylase [Paludisphaera mucosa]|uniref:Glycosylase n=1 Tax=Paludisphaera mucosa TaxID=3030827 RepID=A0ABT6FEW2_9BACT|nr:glycosylase [Paludisphaera mucosa]MDG3006120.1 glycosylase [Paludisphaera mucosa]
MLKSMLRAILGIGLMVSGGASAGAFEEPWRFTGWRPVEGNPVFRGTGEDTWDRKIRERGFVLPEGGGYTLWYTGYDRDRPTTMSLGRATSIDGKAWRRDPANPVFRASWVEDVCVVRVDGTYHMFAEGRGDVAHRLSSLDGVRWTDHGPLDVRKVDGSPIGPGSFGTPTAWHEDGVWRLFYERGDQGVWLATSRDLKVWKNVKDEPVLARGPEPFDRAMIAVNQVVRRDGFYYMFYHALADAAVRDWTTNLARSRDLVHWEKYPGNPIVGGNCSSAVLVPSPEGDRLYTMHPEVRLFEPDGR